MIEIRKIREYTPKGNKNAKAVTKKAETAFDPEIKAETLADLFNELETLVGRIPESERYNCYFTLGHADASSTKTSRTWQHQDVIPFDIDNCEYIDDSPNPKYLDVIRDALGVDLDKCVIIATGNGLQVLVKPNFVINDVNWFKHNGKYYQALCGKITDSLSAYGLKGNTDSSAFEPNRLFRLPLTKNRKPNKPERVARLLKSKLTTSDFDLAKASGIPILTDDDVMPVKSFSRLRLDKDAVLSGCEFIKWTKAQPQNVTEPMWYAMLSIIGRLPGGEALAQEYSKDHPGYSARETERKFRQSVDASGPRTCDNINKHWGKCKECPNFQKVPSPISLKGESFIATLDSGFHTVTKKGALLPQPDDLLKFYEQKHSFLNANKSHYRWLGTHWKNVPDEFVKEFAQKHYDPACDNQKASEFFGRISRHHLREVDFFTQTIHRKLNLENGVLDIDTMKLEPHSTSLGFQWCLPFKFDAIAQCPTFDKFISDITCNDKSLENVLLEYMGYCLSNDRPLAQKFMVLTGSGSNGKNTLIDILKALGLGGFTTLKGKQLTNTFDVTMLQGSLFNITSEMPKYADSEFWETLKDVVGGTTLTGAKKNKDAFQFDVRTKFILLVNELPKGGEPSDGLFRRFLIVPMDAKFSEKAGNLVLGMDRFIIENELPGVLNRVLASYHQLVENKYRFTKSEKTEMALEDYKNEADNVSRWAQDNIQAVNPTDLSLRPNEWLLRAASNEFIASTRAMRQAYAKWATDAGESAVSETTFSRRLIRWMADQGIGFEKVQVKVNGNVVRGFKGIGFVSEEEY